MQVLSVDLVDRAQIERISAHLDGGGLLGYPTETVYGLGAAATREGVEAVRELKGRGRDKPFLILLPGSGPDRSDGLTWGPIARALAAVYWPGPLTLVLRDVDARYPEGVRGPKGGVAVRSSSHPFVRALMKTWKRPLLSTSANRPGEPPVTTVDALVGLTEAHPDSQRLWIVDGGELPPSDPSTIVDCTGARPRLVREGSIAFESLLEEVDGLVD